MKVSPANSKEDCIAIQEVFNHRDIIGLLGGFCMLEGLIGKLKSSGVSLWKTTTPAGTIIGGMEIGGRSQCHLLKFGSVGVLPEYQRQRCGTMMYTACAFQGVLEGRRLCEDTIISDNPVQFLALPKLGITQVGLLPQKTASFKDIAIFAFLVTTASIEHLFSRLPPACSIELIEDAYTDDLWEKNMIIYKTKKPEFVDIITTCRERIRKDGRISITRRESRSIATRSSRPTTTLF